MIEVTFGLKHCSVNSAGVVNQVKFFDFWRTGANHIPRLGGLSRAIKLRSKYRVHLLKIILFQKSLPPSLWLDWNSVSFCFFHCSGAKWIFSLFWRQHSHTVLSAWCYLDVLNYTLIFLEHTIATWSLDNYGKHVQTQTRLYESLNWTTWNHNNYINDTEILELWKYTSKHFALTRGSSGQ